MKKFKFFPSFSKNLDKSLTNLYFNRETPKWIFTAIILFYILVSFFLTKAARSHNVITLFGSNVPVSTFAGVFSSLANICIIFLVVFFRKTGLITALAILLLQFPILIFQFIANHNSASISGLFSNLLTIIACIIICVNKSVIEKYQGRFRYQAVTDSLTGLPNRFACKEFMRVFIKSGVDFAIVSIDLNNFKNINDIMGHEIGDKVLIEIAARWKALADSKQTQTGDFVARLGGDEFALVIMAFQDTNDIIDTINSYKEELEKPITIDDCDYFMSACFGCAQFPSDAHNVDALFSCADAALHEIKRQNSSNSILHFSSDLLKTEQNLEIERKIRAALNNDMILCYLQPQYDASHNLRGFEALARLQDTDGSFISPVEFIPVAEKADLIDLVDIQVFKKAAAFLKDILKTSDKDIIMSINVSVRHLMKNSFIAEIKNVINTSGIPANHFEIEITESIMIDSAEKALGRINEIKKMGMKIAIDDFGTGYSSLSYLNKIPADSLKIDKSFIDAMNSSDSSKQYVASIISIGHVLNFKVISEGVEMPEQLETLQNAGCDYIQGYFWGRPMPLEEAAKLI